MAASLEFGNRGEEAGQAGEEWARNTQQPRANLARVAAAVSETGFESNVTLADIGLPAVAMEDPERWDAAIKKETQRMKEFNDFGPL